MKYLIIFFILFLVVEVYWLLDKSLELKFNIEEGGDAVLFSYGLINDVICFFVANLILIVLFMWKYYRDLKSSKK